MIVKTRICASVMIRGVREFVFQQSQKVCYITNQYPASPPISCTVQSNTYYDTSCGTITNPDLCYIHQLSTGGWEPYCAPTLSCTTVSCSNCGNCCVPNCSGKTCGTDGCGGSCGSCGGGQTCNGSGQCEPTNICSGKACVANTGGNPGTSCSAPGSGNATCGGCIQNGGAPPNGCDDANVCTTDTCNLGTGLCSHANTCTVTGNCTINPNPALVGSNVVFNANPSGGISPYTCDWSGPVSGVNGTGVGCSRSYIPGGSGGPWTTETVKIHDNAGNSYTPPACPSYSVQDFTVSASPLTLSITTGGASGQITVTAHSVNGFSAASADFTFGYSKPAPLPAGLTGSWTGGLNHCLVPANGTCSRTFDVAAPTYGPGNVVFTFIGTYAPILTTRSAPNVTVQVSTGGCVKDCSGKCGGPDGCGGTCTNNCGGGTFCNGSNTCVPNNICSSKACIVNPGNPGTACVDNTSCGGCITDTGAPPNGCDDGDPCTTDTCTLSTGICKHSGSCSGVGVNCAVNPNPALVGDLVTFDANPSGGTAPYTCIWRNGPAQINGPGACTQTYTPTVGNPPGPFSPGGVGTNLGFRVLP
jgi:hypothetical protein